jgi:hypothetical protein
MPGIDASTKHANTLDSNHVETGLQPPLAADRRFRVGAILPIRFIRATKWPQLT